MLAAKEQLQNAARAIPMSPRLERMISAEDGTLAAVAGPSQLAQPCSAQDLAYGTNDTIHVLCAIPLIARDRQDMFRKF